MDSRYLRLVVSTAVLAGSVACSQKVKKRSMRAGAAGPAPAAAPADPAPGAAPAPGDDSIASGVSCPTLKAFYDDIWQPIIADKCITCHTADGFANYSNLKLSRTSKWSELAANLKLMAAVAQRQTDDGVSYLVAKPTRQTNHDGGLIFEKSDPRAQKLADFAKAPPSLEGCDAASAGALTDPLALLKDMSETRLLRRASLAIRGELPELSDYDDLESGKHTYAEFLDTYLNDGDSEKFAHRLEKHHLRRLLKNFVGESKIFNPKPLGEGVAWRLKGWVGGPAHFYTPHPSACMTLPQSGQRKVDEYIFKTWETSQPAPLETCALESPVKAYALLARKMLLSASHPLKKTWMYDWNGDGRTRRPFQAVEYGLINRATDYDDKGNILLPYTYWHHTYNTNWLAGTYFDWGVSDGESFESAGHAGFTEYAKWIPSPGNDGNAEAYPEMWRPGWFTGCLLPGEDPVTDEQWTAMKAGALLPRLDTAGLPIQPGAYAAVKVQTWWGDEVYACPGLAIEEAVQAGIVDKAPPFYRRNPANNNASEYLPAKRLPDMVDNVPTATFFNERYRSYHWQPDHSIVTYGALEYSYYGMLGNERLPQHDGEWVQEGAFGEDTLQNPLVDCGDHMRYCNPHWAQLDIAATYEGQALYRGLIKTKRPYRDFLSGKVRATNRALEFAWFHRQQETTSLLGAGIKMSLPGDSSQAPKVAGIWPHGDLLAAIKDLPPLPNAAWETLPQSPHLYSTNKGEPEPPEDVLQTFRLTDRPTGAPIVGILTSGSFLNNYIVNRTRANKLNQFFQCKAFPPASGDFQIDPSEVGKAPRLMVKSGCSGCHDVGGVDRYAGHFMEWAGDILNVNFRVTPAHNSPFKLLPYAPADKIVADDPSGYYGMAPDGKIDSWKDVPVSKGAERLAEILGEEPGFTNCTVESLWQIMLARMPSADEKSVFDGIVATFQGKPYTLQDIAKAIAQSEAFRKSP